MNFKVCGVSVRGRAHEIENSPCQDSIFYKSYGNKSFIALGDGAGSKKFSQIGSKVITSEICGILNRDFDYIYKAKAAEAKNFIISKLCNSLQIEASKKNIAVSELSSTLMFLGIKDSKLIIGHLGDGMICMKKGEKIEILSKSEEREYSNTTYFVSPKNAMKLNLFRGDLNILKAVKGFFLFTDGCENFLYSKRLDSVNPILNEVLNFLNKKSEKQVNKQIKISINSCIKEKKTFDDCSLGILSINTNRRVIRINKGIRRKAKYRKCLLNR
ncbi:PP2C family serine/threonine-protein phosphatase [uncultured Cetobacterium sp.]|uniref:PP2C family serine/threonine-protein phosphatase n=1 Tax=Cetobacterium sp. TaxID=2071632 RepID=UPI0025DEA1EA|nr:PP2C family serine/threonine-protein phosphatase [uncultured Cetobacterium sp.]